MLSDIPQEFNKFTRNCQHLRRILKETHRALDEIVAANIFAVDVIRERFFQPSVAGRLNHILNCHPALLLLGQNCNAKAVLINALFGEELFPYNEESWRWVRISCGNKSRSSVVLNLNFKEIEVAQTAEKTWLVVPVEDLRRPESEKISQENVTMLEVYISHPLLQNNVQLIVPPDQDCLDKKAFKKMLEDDLRAVLPIVLFAVGGEALSPQHIEELRELKELYPELPVYFICTTGCVAAPGKMCPQDGEISELPSLGKNLNDGKSQGAIVTSSCYGSNTDRNLLALIHQLASLGYLHLEESEECRVSTKPPNNNFPVGNVFLDDLKNLDQVVTFVHGCLQSYLIQAANLLNEVQSHCLRQFILSAFDMAREIQITPRRIQYAQDKEMELYKNLISIAGEKQEEIRHIIESTLQQMKSGLVERAADYNYHGVILSENEEVQSPQDVRVATSEIHYLVLSRLSSAVASQLMESVDCLRETYVGTLQRCLESLEKNCYEQEGNLLASDAFKQILSAAYSVELTTSSSSSLLHSFMERLRKLLHTFQLPWTSPRRLDALWRRRVATEMLESLSASRLARSISTQFRERVKSSHEAFQAALRVLENHYSGHLERTEEQRVAIRKYHAPKLARLALDSTSMCDVIQHGVPILGKEIGRGHYGVVFSCESWGGTGPCAVKSVVPPDEKHWNDLAMEFYYTRTIAEHRHIVRLRGSVIDSSYGGGCTPSVLLVMDRLSRDLYCGLQSGLEWLVRLQIAIDVVEGIRYLHSQGLVHRDIKLKNVLLDSENNAKLTDLGFCIPEAMMSGSIVGTPAHMAPELLSGHYDSSVDVYAFGILFWYICAGHVRLPYAFEQFRNKEQLWTSVRRGIRPERLPYFDEDCWQLMHSCWAAEPTKRPLLGYVLLQLEAIKERSISFSL
ncbi:dual serine/threonine and tyrosine protein kinase [Anabrus simplex]|uniref:dual serine/threonine and tyrosine protein kinase n=1 Tax=Anabrus simplex TaxID=316456 RepID=UPI0035A3AC06